MIRNDFIECGDPNCVCSPHVFNEAMHNIEAGKRFNEGKPELSQNPPEALIAAAKGWMYGAKKYGRYNWRKGGDKLSYMSIMDSMMRHMTALQMGEDIDPESGLPHSSLILCNAMMLSTFFETKTGVDDRYHGTNNQTS